jgi:hypothetical protein
MAKDPVRHFQLRTDVPQEGTGLRPAYVVICQSVGHDPADKNQDTIWFEHGESANQQAAEKHFRAQGWHTNQRQWICPSCWNAAMSDR